MCAKIVNRTCTFFLFVHLCFLPGAEREAARAALHDPHTCNYTFYYHLTLASTLDTQHLLFAFESPPFTIIFPNFRNVPRKSYSILSTWLDSACLDKYFCLEEENNNMDSQLCFGCVRTWIQLVYLLPKLFVERNELCTCTVGSVSVDGSRKKTGFHLKICSTCSNGS